MTVDVQGKWYELSRQHELELNKAALQYEHERLKFLAYLNGGAATAFLTFYAAIGTDVPLDSFISRLFSAGAVVIWTSGLFAAWKAWSRAHEGQSAFTTAFRMRRYGVESETSDSDAFGIELRWPPRCGESLVPVSAIASAATLREAADRWRLHGRNVTKRAWLWARASVWLFMVGAAVAAVGMASGHLRAPTPTSATPSSALACCCGERAAPK